MPRFRANGEGSLYRVKTGPKAGRWAASISDLGRRRVVYGATREEASQKLIDLLAKRQSGALPAAAPPNLEAFLGRWLEDIRPSLQPKTWAGYRDMCTNHLVPRLGKAKLTSLAVAHVQRMVNDLSEQGHRRTAKAARDVLRSALNQAMREGLLVKNVAALARAPQQGATIKGKFLTMEQASALLQALAGDRWEALYVVALSLGLRQGEVLALRWGDVDLEAGTLTIRNALQQIPDDDLSPGRLDLVRVGDPNDHLYLKPTKTELARRTLRLPEIAVDALRAHRQRLVDEQLPVTPAGFVFVNQLGHPLKSDAVRLDFTKRVLPLAGLPHFRFYDLRHSAATILLAQGVDALTVRTILGHSTIAQTSEYAKVMRSLHDDAADAMNRALRGPATRSLGAAVVPLAPGGDPEAARGPHTPPRRST